jgi:hypothetical protein
MAGADPPHVPPGPGMPLEAIRCSFCGKRGSEVDKIIAGPTPAVAICNECVDVCREIMAGERDEGGPGAPAA